MSSNAQPQRPKAEISPEKLKFLGMVSHELKTPLNAIIGFSNMIEKQMLGPVGSAEYVEFAREIQTSGRALLRLVEELITTARSEAEGLKPANAHVDLATAAAAAMREAAPMAQQKAQTLRNLVRDEAPGIWGDGRSIRQTIGSLIDNACKFGPEAGEILLSGARLPSGEYCLTVEDAGPGFPATMVAELTEAFRQGDDAVGRAFEGVGLGLYLARQTMAMHEGRLEIDNRPEGGARATLIFPPSIVVGAGGAGTLEDDFTVMDEDEEDEAATAMLELAYEDRRFHLFAGDETFAFGRRGGPNSSNLSDLLVEDRRASRAHAQIVSIDGQFHVVDESRRGTFVAPDGGAVEHVHLNVSQPLVGQGVIALGDRPDAEGVARIRYRLAVGGAGAA